MARNLSGIQDRSHRWLFEEAEIRVPGIAEGADVPLVRLLEHGDDIGMLVHVLYVWYPRKRAEEAAEGQMLAGREVLVAEEKDKMLNEGTAELVCRRVRQRLCQIDAMHVRAERPCYWPHLDRLVEHLVRLRSICSMETGQRSG